METKIISINGNPLTLIKTDKFKTVKVRVILRQKSKKENITKRNFLASLLTYSTKNYSTKRNLILKTQDLYAANIHANCYRSGIYDGINIVLDVLNDKYTEKGNFEESLKLLNEVITNPDIIDNKFNEESFNNIYEVAKKTILSLKEDKGAYSTIRMLENMGDAPYSYRECGYLEDLENTTRENMVLYYNDLMKNSYIDMYLIGNIDFDEMENLAKKYLSFNNELKNKESAKLLHEEITKEQVIIEEDNTLQSKLAIGCRIQELSDFDFNYTLSLYSMILGGSADSKFFKNIREKNSLAYYIHSVVNRLENLMIIKSGISKDNFEKVVTLVKEEMKNMQEGFFTEEDIINAKNVYLTWFESAEDDPSTIIESYVAMDLLKTGTLKERKEAILKVTKEDIIRVSKQINIDTIYLLKGVETNGNN